MLCGNKRKLGNIFKLLASSGFLHFKPLLRLAVTGHAAATALRGTYIDVSERCMTPKEFYTRFKSRMWRVVGVKFKQCCDISWLAQSGLHDSLKTVDLSDCELSNVNGLDL